MNNGNSPAMANYAPDGAKYLDTGAMGLTKREHFAAMAMQGLMSSGLSIDLGPSHSVNNYNVALCSLTMADALLEVLDNQQGE